jgi:hypothetical protein
MCRLRSFVTLVERALPTKVTDYSKCFWETLRQNNVLEVSHCKNTRCERIYNLLVNLGRHQQKACVYWTAWSCKVAELPRTGDRLSSSHLSVAVDSFCTHYKYVTSPGCPSSQNRLATCGLDICMCISNLLVIPCWSAQTEVAFYK